MLVIRKEQLRVLSEPMVLEFEKRAISHIRSYFPEQCKALEEADLIDAVRYGMSQAEDYGLKSERDIFRYLTLMFIFGREFDNDPSFPWAKEILNSSSSPIEKTNRLQSRALQNRSLGKGYLATLPPEKEPNKK